MAFEMEQITAPLDPVDLSTVVSLFDGLSLEEVERPVGHIDLLIGIQDAGFFPICKHRLRDTRGHLRVLSSLFGTGRVMDGSHPGINGSPLMQTEECHHISRSRIAGPSTVTGEPTSSYGFGQPAVLNRVFGREFEHLEHMEAEYLELISDLTDEEVLAVYEEEGIALPEDTADARASLREYDGRTFGNKL